MTTAYALGSICGATTHQNENLSVGLEFLYSTREQFSSQRVRLRASQGDDIR